MNAQLQEKEIISKVSWRLIPFLVVSYLLCFVDRVNLGFAALTMNTEFGFTATIFGWGAGILFIGYFFFGVPSNLALQKYGARKWLALIMVVWGILSACMAFIQGTASFLCLRFLLGAAEAGFFPGVILYLTYWFPAKYRGVIISRFMFAQPIALMLGSALSGWILGMDGYMGVAGWKWMFILEGLPSSVMGVIALSYLTDTPAKANWLKPTEREWLQSTLDEERAKVESTSKLSLMETMSNKRVIVLGIVYTSIVTGIYGINLWLPQIVKGFGNLSSGQIGMISAIPFLAAAIGMLLIGISSDKMQERKWHVTISMVIAGASLLGSAVSTNPALTVFLLSVCSIGLYGCMPIFWTIPPTFLAGTAAAAGIAFINAIGNLGGFVGPFVVGWIKDTTGSFMSGLIFLGTCVLIGSVIAYFICRKVEKASPVSAKKIPA